MPAVVRSPVAEADDRDVGPDQATASDPQFARLAIREIEGAMQAGMGPAVVDPALDRAASLAIDHLQDRSEGELQWAQVGPLGLKLSPLAVSLPLSWP